MKQPKVEYQARSITGRLLRSFDTPEDLQHWRTENPTVGCELVKVTTMVEVEPFEVDKDDAAA